MSDQQSDLQCHRVAVTVFCQAHGVDEHDAGHVATYAIRQALSGGPLRPLPVDVPVALPAGAATVTVHDVLETGLAAGNGYLWLRPTRQAYREER